MGGFGFSIDILIFVSTLSLMIMITHRSNIKRIMNGTEAKGGSSKE